METSEIGEGAASLVLKVLPPLSDPRLEVRIRGETRSPKLTEPVILSEDIFRQAGEVGEQLFRAVDNLPDFLSDRANRE